MKFPHLIENTTGLTSGLVFLLLAGGACGRLHPRPPRPLPDGSDPFNVIIGGDIKDGRLDNVKFRRIPSKGFGRDPIPPKDETGVPPPGPIVKVHPVLQGWLSTRPATDIVRIIARFADSTPVPRFPEPAMNEPRDSRFNTAASNRARQLIEGLQRRRQEQVSALFNARTLGGAARVHSPFWLVPAVEMDIPLGGVQALSNRQDVVFLQPAVSGALPPQDANANNDAADARGRIVSDPYFGLGLPNGWIGLLDTGMRFSHNMFNSPGRVTWRRDCVNGGADCNTGRSLNPNDDCWDHGTATAGILSGNARRGADFRGVTEIRLDSFKVYPTAFNSAGACSGGLDDAAAVRGFENAVAGLDRVIVAEMQGGGNQFGAISAAADAAFNAGSVVIAANGNNGPGAGSVNEPAVAHKVIGIGNFDVETLGAIASQSRGPTSDNRIKPDIQAPTNSETASNASDTALTVFTGTSGATPYAAGAAALLRNWILRASGGTDPGQVYAFLILAGQTTAFNNTAGAGPLQLPVNGHAWWGKVTVNNGGTIDIPIAIRGSSVLDAALWWPEETLIFRPPLISLDPHSDIDLQLIDPRGNVGASSTSIPSVFEKARVNSPRDGAWKVRIRGYKVDSVVGQQTVYWAVTARR